MGASDIERALAALIDQGVEIVDPRQTYVASDVDLGRVRPGATLHPGTRLLGARTFIGAGAQVGAQGPATVIDGVLGRGARIDAGYIERAVLLDGAQLGWGAHARPGTLLEEGASTAHCVGLKHTILLSFVTVGSVVNLCDLLVAGGTSSRDHSEIGSGFIHFNFTPWGERGDKATASLVGDVPRGVFLREKRIFLGGAGGMVGPRQVGFGAVMGAGSVARRDIGEAQLSLEVPRPISRAVSLDHLDAAPARSRRNVQYIAQLVALREWYRKVRLPRCDGDERRAVLEAARDNLDEAIAERVKRLQAFLAERGEPMPALSLDPSSPAPSVLVGAAGPGDHVAWVQSLADDVVAAGTAWLADVVAAVTRE